MNIFGKYFPTLKSKKSIANKKKSKLVSIKYNLDHLKQSDIDGGLDDEDDENNNELETDTAAASLISSEYNLDSNKDDEDLYLELDSEVGQLHESDGSDEENERWEDVVN